MSFLECDSAIIKKLNGVSLLASKLTGVSIFRELKCSCDCDRESSHTRFCWTCQLLDELAINSEPPDIVILVDSYGYIREILDDSNESESLISGVPEKILEIARDLVDPMCENNFSEYWHVAARVLENFRLVDAGKKKILPCWDRLGVVIYSRDFLEMYQAMHSIG